MVMANPFSWGCSALCVLDVMTLSFYPSNVGMQAILNDSCLWWGHIVYNIANYSQCTVKQSGLVNVCMLTVN